MKPKVLFIEQFYHPEGWGGAQLPLDLTMHLARNGFDVEVICGTEQYAPVEEGADHDPQAAGVTIRRIPRFPLGGRHFAKVIRQLWFNLAAIPSLFLRKRPALLVVQTNPPLGIVLSAMAAKIWRRPMVIIAMDIYPDVIVAYGAIARHGVVARMLRVVFSWAYRSADRVVALGPVMRERLTGNGVQGARIVEIPNWSTGAPGVIRGAANPLRQDWNLMQKFVVLYSGNVGIGHEFDTFLAGFSQACAVLPDLRLVFIGKGSRLAQVQRAVGDMSLSGRVVFHGFLPASRLPESIGLADMALVTLRSGFEGLVVPSKLYGYMSRGVPVLYVGPRSDTEISVLRAGCGMVVRTGDADGVREALIKAHSDRTLLQDMGNAGQAAYDAELTSAHALTHYELLFKGLIRDPSAA